MGSLVPGFKIAEEPSKINDSADYVLILSFEKDVGVEVGALGKIKLKKGSYAYCGSAKSGLWSRVKRHLSDPEKKRWHIDHITGSSSERRILWRPHSEMGECKASRYLSNRYDEVTGFGCSDCKCGSHLYYLGDEDIKV